MYGNKNLVKILLISPKIIGNYKRKRPRKLQYLSNCDLFCYNTTLPRRGSEHRCAGTPDMAKSPSSLMSFCSPSYFPANNFFCLCLAPHSLNSPYFPIVLTRTSLPKIFLSMLARGPSFSVLSFTSLYPFLPCTSFPSCISFTPHPKIFLSIPARGSPPAYFLPFPVLDFTSTFL